jgi:arylsulfatase A-like enzyme
VLIDELAGTVNRHHPVPVREEHQLGRRLAVPAFVRWPGKIKAGSVINGIVSHQDWLPTFLAASAEPDIKEKLLNGHKIGDKTYKTTILLQTVRQIHR